MPPADDQEALVRSVVSQFEQYVKLNRKIPPEVLVSVNQIDEPANALDSAGVRRLAELLELLLRGPHAVVSALHAQGGGHAEEQLGLLERLAPVPVRADLERLDRERELVPAA